MRHELKGGHERREKTRNPPHLPLVKRELRRGLPRRKLKGYNDETLYGESLH